MCVLGVKFASRQCGCGRSTARRHGTGILRALEHNALVRAWHNGGQGLNLHIGFGETFVAAPKCSFHTRVTVVAAPSGRKNLTCLAFMSFIQVLIVTLTDRSDVLPDWPAVTRPRVQRYTRGRTANGLGVNVTQTTHLVQEHETSSNEKNTFQGNKTVGSQRSY